MNGFKNPSYKNKQKKHYSEKHSPKRNRQKKGICKTRKQRRDISMFLKKSSRQRKNTTRKSKRKT